jgi:hypothetical protein
MTRLNKGRPALASSGPKAWGSPQNHADVEMGLKTLSDHFQELSADYGEEIERRASDAKYGVPVDMLWKPSGSALPPQTGSAKPPETAGK